MNLIDMSSAARGKFDELRASSNNPASFLKTEQGARLGIDGIDALRATPPELYEACYEAVASMLDGEEITLTGWLSAVDALLACARGDLNKLLPLVCVGVVGTEALGGPPRVCSEAHAIANDTLLLVLSRNYRAVRIAAFNEGASFAVIDSQRDDAFRPDYGVLTLGAPIVVKFGSDVPITQFYNIAHELSHIALLGDTYMRSKGTIAATAGAFLAAEESLIGLDLLMMYELNAHEVDLFAAHAFRGIEPGMHEQVPVSLATIAAKDRRLIKRRQIELKAHAAKEAAYGDELSKWLIRKCGSRTNIDQWVPLQARRKHIDGSLDMARRVCDPHFAQLVAYIPVDHTHARNEQMAVSNEWGHGDFVFHIDIPEVDETKREVERRRWLLRQRLLRTFEAAVHAERVAPNASVLTAVRDIAASYGAYGARGKLGFGTVDSMEAAIESLTGAAINALRPTFESRSEALVLEAIASVQEVAA